MCRYCEPNKLKTCFNKQCNKTLPLTCTNFIVRSDNKPNKFYNTCRICRQKQRNKTYLKNKDIMSISERMWWSLKSNAKKRNIEFTIKPEDIIVPEYCPVFPWIKLNLDNEWALDNSPSCDRIDNNLGYIKTNIIITSYRANRLKQDSNQKEREYLTEFYKNKPVYP